MKRRKDLADPAGLHADRPVIELGDSVELNAEGKWVCPGAGMMSIPAGTQGTIWPWRDPDNGEACAVRFDGFSHPKFEVFPMGTHTPGMSHYPPKLDLVKRRHHGAIATDPCPVIGCQNLRQHHHVMCESDWSAVPTPLKQSVWREFRRGPGSREHLAVVAEAIQSVPVHSTQSEGVPV